MEDPRYVLNKNIYISTIQNYPINNLITISITAPGIPSIPTTIEVKIFNPIWKPKLAPTKLIIYIKTPPNIELNTNFKIFFIGNINILPIKNKKHIHATNVNIFVSKKSPQKLINYLLIDTLALKK